MSLIPFIGGSGATPTGVQLIPNDFTVQGGTSNPTMYSGIKIDADGGVYERQIGGGWSRVFTWLLSGTNSAYYVNRTVVSGSLTTDAGSGSALTLDSDRIYDIQSNIDKGCFVSFELALVSDDSIVASRTYDFEIFTLL